MHILFYVIHGIFNLFAVYSIPESRVKRGKNLIGLDYLVAGYVHLASGQVQCNLRKTPQISVSASDYKVRYDHSKSQRDLEKMDRDTISPYGANIKTHVGGLMNGEISISQNIRFYQETYPGLNVGCLYVDTITVKLDMKPVIYVSKSYPKGSCMYNSVLEHEKKHVSVDQALVVKYRGPMSEALHQALHQLGHKKGPMRTSSLSQAQRDLQSSIQAVVRKYSAQLTAERKKRQQDVDSLVEYERVQARCKGAV